MKNLLVRFVREDEGQDIIEYGLLAAFISVVAWLTLPVEDATRVGEGLILAGALLALARKLHSLATHRPAAHEPTGS